MFSGSAAARIDRVQRPEPEHQPKRRRRRGDGPTPSKLQRLHPDGARGQQLFGPEPGAIAVEHRARGLDVRQPPAVVEAKQVG
jgi:hypothetical protein